MGKDETKPDSSERAAKADPPDRAAVVPALEEDVMRALLNPDERSADEIDELLTRCAAETLLLQAGRTGPRPPLGHWKPTGCGCSS